METDLVEKRLILAEIKWNTLHWHKATLMVLMNKVEKETLSKIKQVPRASIDNIDNNIDLARKKYTEAEVEYVYAEATKATKEHLEARREHHYLTMEYLGVLENIEATANLVAEYSKSVKLSTKEEDVFISNDKISEKIKEIERLDIKDKKQKETFEDLRREFLNDISSFTKRHRFEFYGALCNLCTSNL